jgi:hypothetical protein
VAVAATLAMMTMPATAQQVAADPATVIAAAPEGTQMLIVIPDPAGTSEQIARLNESMGIDLPELENLLQTFLEEEADLEGEYDGEGPVAVAITDLAPAFDNDPPHMVVMITTDADEHAALLNAMGRSEDLGGGVTQFSRDGFARHADGMTLLSPQRDAVANPQPGGQTLDQLIAIGDAAFIGGADAMIYIDLDALEPLMAEGQAAMRQQMQREVERAERRGSPEAGMMRLGLTMMDGMYTMLDEGAVSAVGAIDLTDDGVSIQMGLEVAEGGPLAAYLNPGAAAGGTGDLLARLPDQPYIFTTAINHEAVDMTRIIQQLIDVIPDEYEGLAEIYRLSLSMLENSDGSAQAFFVPDQAALMGGGILNTLTVYQSDEPDQFVQQMQQMVTRMNGMNVPLALGPGEQIEMGFTATYEDAVAQVEGADVDSYRVNVVLPPEMMQQFAPMMMVLGNLGYGGYVAPVEDHVVVTTAQNLELLGTGLTAAADGGGLGTGGVLAAVREAHMPEDLAMETYINPAGLALMANPFMAMVPNGRPIEVPEDLPPMATGLAVQESGLVMQMFVPTPTVRFVVDTVQQLEQQFNGGGAQEAVGPVEGEHAPVQREPGQGPPPAPF